VKKISLRGATVAIQGLATPATPQHGCWRTRRRDYRAERHPRRRDELAGIDPIKAIRYKERSGTVVGIARGFARFEDDLLT